MIEREVNTYGIEPGAARLFRIVKQFLKAGYVNPYTIPDVFQ